MARFRYFYLWARFIRTPSELISRLIGNACHDGGGNSLVFNRKSLFGEKGVEIRVPRDKYIFEKFMKNGYFSLPTSIFLSQGLKKGCNSILDLGAHAGLVSLQAIRIARETNVQVIAVEPIPSHHECLRANFKDLKLESFAAGFANGNEEHLKIFVDKENLGNSSILPVLLSEKLDNDSYISVQAVSLEKVLRGIGTSNFLLKSDLQGLDLHVLSSMKSDTWRQVRRGVIEVNSHIHNSKEECMRLLDKLENFFYLSWEPYPFKEVSRMEVQNFWLSGKSEERDLFLISKI